MNKAFTFTPAKEPQPEKSTQQTKKPAAPRSKKPKE
jgi:hypothetical protein